MRGCCDSDNKKPQGHTSKSTLGHVHPARPSAQGSQPACVHTDAPHTARPPRNSTKHMRAAVNVLRWATAGHQQHQPVLLTCTPCQAHTVRPDSAIAHAAHRHKQLAPCGSKQSMPRAPCGGTRGCRAHWREASVKSLPTVGPQCGATTHVQSVAANSRQRRAAPCSEAQRPQCRVLAPADSAPPPHTAAGGRW
jgi:hypothetical protein